MFSAFWSFLFGEDNERGHTQGILDRY